MEFVIDILAYLVLGVQISLIGTGIFYLVQKLTGRGRSYWKKYTDFLSHYYRELSLLVATVATSGSLFMSNILGWSPCRLCWFQRIMMYPLVILGAVSLVLEKDDVEDYMLPLVLIGAAIALVHSLIQRYEQFSSAGCSLTSVSCSTKYTFYFGYISVPVMALTAFIAIGVLVWKFSDHSIQ